MYKLSNLVPKPYDNRDYLLSIPAAALSNLPNRKDLRTHAGDIEDQSTTGTCVTNATVSALEWALAKAGTFKHLSRLFIYFNIREAYDNLRGVDGGSYLFDAYKSVASLGVPPEDVWPFVVSQVNTRPSAEAYTEALKMKVTKYEKVGTPLPEFNYPMIQRIKAALAMGYPVIMAMHVHRDIFTVRGSLTSATCKYNTLVSSTNEYAGAHAMCFMGYDDALGGFIVENSWGTSWGDQGYGIIGYEALNQQLFDAWTCTAFNGIEFAPEWDFLPIVPMTLSMTPQTEVHYLSNTDALYIKIAALNVDIKDGTPRYRYKWSSSSPNVAFITPDYVVAPIVLLGGLAANEIKSITITCEVTDCSLPTYQVARINTTVRVCNAVNIETNFGKAYRVYQAAFNRIPDAPGHGFWVSRLNAGMGLYDVSREFINSAEFKSIYGETLSPTDFVTLLYRNVLVREPDTGGLNYWIGRINTGMSKEEVLIHFSESAENKSKVTW